MRAVDIKNGTGHADALFINDSAPKPTASTGEAIVKVKAFGLNRMDLLQREGHYPVPPQAPKTLGVEFSGTIESLGSGVKEGLSVGDEVFGLAYGGAYAEYLAVNTHMLLKKPSHLSWEEAAGIPETWITATQALYLVGEFAEGKSVLWHAGASSVSIAGVQLAKNSKAGKIFVTAGSQEKIDFCVNELGATAGFNYKTQDWAKEILDATDGKGVDVIVDFIGANYFQGNLNVAAKDARIVQLGVMSGTKVKEVDISAFVMKRVRFEGSTLRSRDVEYQKKLRDRLWEYMEKFEDGTFKIFVDTVLPWEKVVEAHQLMEKNTSKGKIICTIS
ncbi:quinone oxidoreductase protein [Rutstroemia sp. NJR-2017a BBW]|nr:quinone oxidoreductase protein [Rutstroemia sp. NJR-2017a BBW]